MAYPRSPGPAHYKIPPSIGYKDHNKTKWIMPAYSIGNKHRSLEGGVVPGPQYMVRDQTRFGYQRGPAFTINRRTALRMGSSGPGPGTYKPEQYATRKAPVFSFGKRPASQQITVGPGPASYNVRRDKPPGPAFNILGRQTQKMLDKSPGPAAYNPKYSSVDKRPRVIKFSGRPDTSGLGKAFGPGPGHYKYQLVGRSTPKFSFGTKHKEWLSPYIVPEDNACTYPPRKS
ncbi:outer dense fiber protein 3-B [Nilaparvata lugens]|uniref:outer dense fiber protein 3-B n=1 Tax=Nilaparvata lugens TaxID=108931 RepID=UPI00193E5D19|nr:outer dense fiber protein 3-B [Nilaparvata lugens]